MEKTPNGFMQNALRPLFFGPMGRGPAGCGPAGRGPAGRGPAAKGPLFIFFRWKITGFSNSVRYKNSGYSENSFCKGG